MKHEKIHPMKPVAAGQARLDAMLGELETILFAEPGPDWADREAELLEEFAPVVPDAPANIRRAALRLVLGFLQDPQGLIAVAVPSHLMLLRSYIWAPTRKPEEFEGAGSFWLFRASNEVLDQYESQALGTFMQFFRPNVHRAMAARAWIRLQACYLDTDKVGDLIRIVQENTLDDENPYSVPGREFIAGA